MVVFANLSIRNKFVVIVLIIISITMVLSEVIDHFLEKQRSINTEVKNILLDARLISDYCVVPLEFEDKNTAYKTLEKLESKPNIKNAWLFDQDFQLFTMYGDSIPMDAEANSILNQENYALIGDFIYAKSPVVYNNEPKGLLVLKAKTDIREIGRKRILISLGLISFMIVLALLLSAYFQKYLSFAILKLTRFTQQISATANYSKRITKTTQDEVGQLYDEFNNLLNVIEKANSELEIHKNQLEKLVETRTEALKATNAKLIKAKEIAEEANRTKSEFLSSMSHELRTPLNGILGYAQLLKTIGNLTETQKKQVDIIHSSGKHLLSLINEILDFSKIEAKKLEVVEKSFSLKDLISHVLNIMKVRAEQKDLMLKYENSGNLPDFVKGDEIKVRQILINLLSNAVKYSNAGKVTLRAFYNREENPNLRFEIEDTGIGIAKDQLDKIFEPFTQINSNTKFVEGTGLGLAITAKLIKLLNGALEVSSEIQKGSIFTVKLNLAEADQVITTENSHLNIMGYSGDKIKILAVDDNLTNLSLLVAALEPLGFEILTAENGTQAVEIAKKENPELILMDLVMPDYNGIETIHKIKELEQKPAKFIGLTASVINQQELIDFAKNCHANLNKPVEIDELFKTIANLLNISWIIEEDTEIEEANENAVVTEDAIYPDAETCKIIITLTEIGDFNSIKEKLQDLLNINKNYHVFVNTLLNYIEQYNSEKIVNYINSLKQ